MHTFKVSRVALVEDDSRRKNELAGMIDAMEEFQLLSACGSVREALEIVDWSLVDVLLCGCRTLGGGGPDLIRKARKSNPGLMPMVISDHCNRTLIYEFLHAGALGFLLMKADFAADFAESLRDLIRGGSPLHPVVARRILYEFIGLSKAPDKTLLSYRETEILKLLVLGKMYKEIADDLQISHHTVHNHVKKIYGKLHVKNRNEAVLVARNRIVY